MTPEEWERFQKRQARKFERPKRNGSLKFFSGNLEEDIAPLGMLRAPPREGHITAGKMNWKDALQLSRDENRRSFEFVSQGELIMLRGMNEIDGGYTASALGVAFIRRRTRWKHCGPTSGRRWIVIMTRAWQLPQSFGCISSETKFWPDEIAAGCFRAGVGSSAAQTRIRKHSPERLACPRNHATRWRASQLTTK